MGHDARGNFQPHRIDRVRREAIRLHPATHSPSHEPAPVTEQELRGRWDRLHAVLVQEGLTDGEALTEVARIAAGEVWNECAERLREYRVAAQLREAAVSAAVLRSIQGVTTPLTLRPGDLSAARSAITGARRRLQHNREVLERAHRHQPVLDHAGEAFRALEGFLAAPREPSDHAPDPLSPGAVAQPRRRSDS